MDQFDIAQSFIERIRGARQMRVLADAFQESLVTLGFRFFACGSHVDPLHPAGTVMLITYPNEWVQCFSEMRLQQIDPVFHHASRSALPFFWDSEEFRSSLAPEQQHVLNEARYFGIDHGYTIPIHSPRSAHAHASCSVVPDSGQLDARAYLAVQLMACYLFEAAAQLTPPNPLLYQPRLSRRERECLELAAMGKDDWVIGRILNLSRATVHNHIESAKRRLGVSTRMQAVVQALAGDQLSFGDVLRAPHLPTVEPERPRCLRGGH